jgi:amino acid efflux transporter
MIEFDWLAEGFDAKLGAALGRNSALPEWFARGSQVGEVPGRSLGVVALMFGLSLPQGGFREVAVPISSTRW